MVSWPGGVLCFERGVLINAIFNLDTIDYPLSIIIIIITIWLFNIAMEHGPFIDGLPIKTGEGIHWEPKNPDTTRPHPPDFRSWHSSVPAPRRCSPWL